MLDCGQPLLWYDDDGNDDKDDSDDNDDDHNNDDDDDDDVSSSYYLCIISSVHVCTHIYIQQDQLRNLFCSVGTVKRVFVPKKGQFA